MNKDDLLYHYFSDSLTKVQEEQFNALLLTDSEFKKQFEFECHLKRVVKEDRHKVLKLKLNQFETELTTKKVVKKTSFLYLKIAASIFVLISAGWLGYKSFFGLNYADLYSENYKSYPNTVFAITRSDNINSIEREAFVAYETENYQLAIDKFNQAEVKEYFTFYKAQSYLMLDDYNKAKRLFEKVINQNKQFVAESYWYKALIYIKEKDKKQALQNLEHLSKHYNYKQSELKKLMDKLK